MGEAGFGITTRLFTLHEQENSKELIGKTQGIICSMERFREQTLTGTTEQGVSEYEHSKARPPCPREPGQRRKRQGRCPEEAAY